MSILYAIVQATSILTAATIPISFLLSYNELGQQGPLLYRLVQRWVIGVITLLSILQNIFLVVSDGILHFAVDYNWVDADEADATGQTLPERHRQATRGRRNFTNTMLRIVSSFLGQTTSDGSPAAAGNAALLSLLPMFGNPVGPGSGSLFDNKMNNASAATDATEVANVRSPEAWYGSGSGTAVDNERGPNISVPMHLPRRRRNRNTGEDTNSATEGGGDLSETSDVVGEPSSTMNSGERERIGDVAAESPTLT